MEAQPYKTWSIYEQQETPKRSEHGCKMMYAGLPSFLGLRLHDGHVSTFTVWTVVKVFLPTFVPSSLPEAVRVNRALFHVGACSRTCFWFCSLYQQDECLRVLFRYDVSLYPLRACFAVCCYCSSFGFFLPLILRCFAPYDCYSPVGYCYQHHLYSTCFCNCGNYSVCACFAATLLL